MSNDELSAAKAALLEVVTSKPIAYYVAFANVGGGVTSGVFLSQLLYWTGKGKDPDGWIYKVQGEWEQETGLTRREQETARKRLRQVGILQEKRAGVPARLHYRVDVDKLIDLLADKSGDSGQSSLAESAKLECTNPPNKDGAIVQASGAESAELSHRLPETTATDNTENTTAAAAGLSEEQEKRPVMCSIHGVEMERREKDGAAWYSHRLADGSWCKGAEGDMGGNGESRGRTSEADRWRYMEWIDGKRQSEVMQ